MYAHNINQGNTGIYLGQRSGSFSFFSQMWKYTSQVILHILMNLAFLIFYHKLHWTYAKGEICQDIRQYRRTNYHNNCKSDNILNLRAIIFAKPTIITIIFWDSLMFYQVFRSPQVKWCAIITYIQVASRVAKRLKTYDLRKLGNIRKVSKLHRIID